MVIGGHEIRSDNAIDWRNKKEYKRVVYPCQFERRIRGRVMAAYQREQTKVISILYVMFGGNHNTIFNSNGLMTEYVNTLTRTLIADETIDIEISTFFP